MSVFRDYAKYYDLLYQDKDYEGEAKFVQRLLEAYAPGAHEVLELGCGSGRHAMLLAGMGYSVTGVDRSPEMLTAARARASCASLPEGALEWCEGDICSVRIGRVFDAAVSLFHVVSYQTRAADLAAAFSTAAVHLKPGGIFLFDCWYGPAVLTDLPRVRVKRVDDQQVRLTRISEPELLANENGVVVNYTLFVEDKTSGAIQQLAESHPMRYLFGPEVESLAEQAGMQVVGAGEWLTDRELGPSTFGAYFAVRREA